LKQSSARIRTTKLIIVLLLVPLGIYTKFYHGPGEGFVHAYLGGILYVIFFIFLASLVFPKNRALKISLIVFVVTCALEFTQLIQTPGLNELREYFLVHALIGSGYTTYDLFFYVLGGIIGYGGLKGITKYFMDN
jgi:glycopeptide antibiotics resistance protein